MRRLGRWFADDLSVMSGSRKVIIDRLTVCPVLFSASLYCMIHNSTFVQGETHKFGCPVRYLGFPCSIHKFYTY